MSDQATAGQRPSFHFSTTAKHTVVDGALVSGEEDRIDDALIWSQPAARWRQVRLKLQDDPKRLF